MHSKSQRPIYRYSFRKGAAMKEVEASLALALASAESLHGESQVRLDAAHVFDEDKRRCVIDASTPVGVDVNRLFVGYLRSEFGAEAFRVERIAAPPPS
jgi:hypothetical protein